MQLRLNRLIFLALEDPIKIVGDLTQINAVLDGSNTFLLLGVRAFHAICSIKIRKREMKYAKAPAVSCWLTFAAPSGLSASAAARGAANTSALHQVPVSTRKREPVRL